MTENMRKRVFAHKFRKPVCNCDKTVAHFNYKPPGRINDSPSQLPQAQNLAINGDANKLTKIKKIANTLERPPNIVFFWKKAIDIITFNIYFNRK